MRYLVILLLPLVLACGVKKTPRPAVTPVPFTLAMSQIVMKSGEIIDVPEELSSAITKVMAKEGYPVAPYPVADYPSGLHKRTLPAHRAAALAEGREGLLVLVEAKALFYSQLRGQNRWVVSGEATALSPAAPEHAIVRRFDVPVFLRYTHEREAEALASAAPTIAERVQRLVHDAVSLTESP